MNFNKFRLITCILFIPFLQLQGQDSLKTTELNEVQVHLFEKKRSKLNSPDAYTSLEGKLLNPSNGLSFVTALNAQAGIRMEERSPGSYRIAIRGSSLRAPFGVRNVKVYWNQIPFTDAGNNTYLSLLEPELFNQIVVSKGPNGGIYGAGTGGALLFNSAWTDAYHLNAQQSYMSLGGLKTSLDYHVGNPNQNHRIFGSFWQQDGYRIQSAVKKQWLSYEFHQGFHGSGAFDLSTYYGDLAYQTPGGLTLKQYQDNPQAARPAAGIFKSAVDQQATFKIKSFGMGTQVSNQLNSAWAYQWMNSFQLNSIENPTIRNYEIRNEPNFSSRGVFHYKGAIWLDAGYEYQIGQFDSQTYGNKKGVKDTLQVSQKTQIQQSTAFLQTEYTSLKNWTFTLSGSLNSYFTQQIFQELIFSPRLAILRKLSPFQSISAKISQGYSPPSISEMRPSTGIINTDLKAEKGWNKEISWRGNLTNKKLSWDLSVYQFDLSETIVVRRAADGSDYFANVGKTTQQGLELSLTWNPHKNLRLIQNTAWQNFRFSDYTTSGKTYSGNFLTGTSPFQNTLMAIYTNPNGFSWTGQYQFMDYMFLNDANTDVLPASRLLHSKISYTHRLANLTYEIWATAENILNETYSSGPDLNAAAGRYFNASPGRNYSLGIKIWVP